MATAKHDSTVQAQTAADRKLSGELRKRVASAQLPGDSALTDSHLDDAAAFLLDAARRRKPGEGVAVVRSAPGARVTRIAVINKDMPFLVDSVAAAVAGQGLSIDLLVHPI